MDVGGWWRVGWGGMAEMRHAVCRVGRLFAAVVWIFCCVGCGREAPGGRGSGAGPAASDARALEPPPTQAAADRVGGAGAGADVDFAALLPKIGGSHGYLGSASCKDCHQDQFASWHRTYHRTMTQVAVGDAIRADFNGVILTNDGTRFVLSRRGEEPWVRMERIGSEAQAVEVRVSLITGSHHMQVFWVPGGDGNTQIGFPFTWLIPERRWVPRNSTFIRPPDAVHRSEVWNVVCSRCHATGIEPRVDAEARLVDTHAGELGISCEACHGPGQRHVDARKAERDAGRVVERARLAAEIVHPEKIDPIRASQVCGFCHSMKWIDRSEAWRQHGFRFRPGENLEETTPIIRPAKAREISGLAGFLERNPELLNDYFWRDGMGRVSGREYNGLIESPCYAGGKFSCLSCHSLHESEPNDMLAEGREGNEACVQCHTAYRDEASLTRHTHHAARSSGSECYNCHMPHTTYGVLKAIRSHQISSPTVREDLEVGRPNACNLCHLDRTLEWTSRQLADWYGRPEVVVPAERRGMARGVDLALRGDAGQRALVAWHLGWGPALAVSGTNWVAAILGQLLDDDYAAVRCVAERSMRSGGFALPNGYDFVVAPRDRASARERVWQAWAQASATRSRSFPDELLLSPADLARQGAVFDAKLRERDVRPMRLRE